jgi:hypothetical protein
VKYATVRFRAVGPSTPSWPAQIRQFSGDGQI